VIVPQSRVDQNNYHLLGNQSVGETRRSRMKRANNVKPHVPSLVNQNPGQQVNIKGAKPLGTTLKPGTGEMVTNSLIAGALAFLTNSSYRFMVKRGKKIGSKDARTGAAIATGVGMLPTIVSSYTDTAPAKPFSGQPLLNLRDIGLSIGIVGAGATVGNYTSGEEKPLKRIPEMKASTLMSVPLAIPALFGGTEGVVKAIFPYGAVLTGLWLSSKYVPATRDK